jgi:FkbM family methyltransferase
VLGRVWAALGTLRVVGPSADATAVARLAFSERRGQTLRLHPRALRGGALLVRPGTADFPTFRSTFIQEYHLPPSSLRSVAAILDLGANVGYTAADLACRFPDARVVAVEMDDANCGQAAANLVQFGERVTCVHAAVWTHNDGVAYAQSGPEDAYTVAEYEADSHVGVKVPSVTIFHLLDMLPGSRADFVKMDVEGAERVLLAPENSEWLMHVETLAVEVHEPGSLEQIRLWLMAAGFVVRDSARHWSALEAVRQPR